MPEVEEQGMQDDNSGQEQPPVDLDLECSVNLSGQLVSYSISLLGTRTIIKSQLEVITVPKCHLVL